MKGEKDRGMEECTRVGEKYKREREKETYHHERSERVLETKRMSPMKNLLPLLRLLLLLLPLLLLSSSIPSGSG